MGLDFSRIYTEPYRFIGNSPYGFETYPWAPIGNGWQIGFPWMPQGSTPDYLHLSSGEGYRIPASFWTGFTSTYDNHQGEHFRISRYIDGSIIVSTSTGTMYSFDSSHRLANITDSIGANIVRFNYDGNNHISTITDTIGRIFLLCYGANNLLHSINQTTTTNCANGTGSVRGVVFGYNTQNSLTSVMDPAGRITLYTYDSTGWLITRITYPTTWYDTYSYTQFSSGQTTIKRVAWQRLNATSTSPIRSFNYAYSVGVGDQVNNSTVATFDGNASQAVAYTIYRFSNAATTWNTTDAAHNVFRGILQTFDAHGAIPKETTIVYDRSGLGWAPGSYTNYYRYDMWGNLIYSKKAIFRDPAWPWDKPSWSHESFNAYYNNGEQPGFFAFQDSFSQNQGFASDNSWNQTSGYWTVSNGVYNGTETTNGPQENMLAYADIGSSDISMQTRLYVARQVNTTQNYWDRVGIFGHYTPGGSNSYKWALVLANYTGVGPSLRLLDETNPNWVGVGSCNWSYGVWYTLNMTIHGLSAWGTVNGGGLSCSVSGTFSSSSHAVAGTKFGLYAGAYSALFDDVRVTTVSPQITTGFTNAFIQNGAPGPTGLNTWLATTKPPGQGWNTTSNWLPANDWSETYASQNYGSGQWGTVTGWTDNNAQWIWWDTNADTYASADPVWFRRVFNLQATTNVNVAIVSDNTYVLYLDGVKLGSQLIRDNWRSVGSYSASLGSGYHILAIATTNTDGPDAAGLLVSVKNTSSGQVIFRSDNTAAPIIVAPAGSAQFQNVTSTSRSVPIESYNSYYGWGGVYQTKQLHNSTGSIQWLTNTMTYDSYGNLNRTIDARGNSTIFGYSNKYQNAYLTLQNQTLIPSGLKIIRSYGYNITTGTKLWSQEPNGYGTSSYNTTYRYDILGRVVRVTQPNGDYVSYTYNDAGNYVDIIDENSLHSRQVYDGLGRLVVSERFSGSSTINQTSTYNWQDKIVTKADPLGNMYRYQYDPLGRPIQTTKPDGNFTQLTYNDVNSWVRLTDEAGFYDGWFWVYDRLGRLIERDEPGFAQSANGGEYYYDEIGNLGRIDFGNVISSHYQPTVYTYDDLNRLIQTTYADNTTERLAYDNNGNGVSKTDRNNVRTLYGYDSLNRLATITYCGSSITSDNYSYDSNGNVLQLQAQNATVVYQYDTRNRLLSEQYKVNYPTSVINLGCQSGTIYPASGTSYSYTIGFAYSGERVSTITYPTGLVVSYGYDNLGRVTTVGKTGLTYGSIAYYNNDQVKTLTYGNGLISTNTYDSLGRVSTISLTTSQTTRLVYAYDKVGTLSSITGQSNGATVNEQYTYDPARHLINATIAYGSTNTSVWYEYDVTGNRNGQSINNVFTSYTLNGLNNELQSLASTGTQASYGYDFNGNLVSRNVTTTGTAHWTYTWDVRGHLLTVNSEAGTVSQNAYDGKGRRVESIEGAAKTFYAYLGTESLYEKAYGGSSYSYIYAGNLRIARDLGSQINYFHTDALGNTRLVTNSARTVVFSESYQPFGQDNSSAGFETYKFTGKLYSYSAGLYYYYQRWYDANTGRFISPDPKPGKLTSLQSLNRYIYVLDLPTSLTDPSGLDWWNPFSWTPQQQAQAFTVAVIVVAIVAVVATGGIASPLAAAAIGAALSSTAYTVSAGDKATLQGAATYAAVGAVLGGVGAAVGGGTAVASTSLARTALVNGGIGASFNVGSYAATQAMSGQAITLSGLAGATVSGFIGGALGTKGLGVPAGSSTLLRWSAGNVAAGVGGYIAGQAVQGQAPTIGGLLETSAFSIIAGGISERAPGEIRGAVFAGAIGFTQPFYDIMAGYGNFGPWSNLGPLF